MATLSIAHGKGDLGVKLNELVRANSVKELSETLSAELKIRRGVVKVEQILGKLEEVREEGELTIVFSSTGRTQVTILLPLPYRNSRKF